VSFPLSLSLTSLIVEFLFVGLYALLTGWVILSRRRDPSATLAWILFMILAPIVGIIAFWLIGRTRMRRVARRRGRAEVQVREALGLDTAYQRSQSCEPRDLEPRTQAQLRLGDALASTRATTGNRVTVLEGAERTYRELLAAISSAERYVHVQFYVIQPDSVGEALRSALVERARAGVEVRVLTDAVGSTGLPSDFWDELQMAGGRARSFGPVLRLLPRLRHRDRVDYRNHRKIVVVDGRVGFTGGINVGREYLGLDPSIGHWRDTHVRIEGPAVSSLEATFQHDWSFSTGELLTELPHFDLCPEGGTSIVQVIDSGPDQNHSTLELYQAHAMASARERILITNPYFVPSQTIENALIAAALRGVRVCLLLPQKSDSRLVHYASRSYYGNLLCAGARIFEYKRGFVHAKTMVIDDWLCTIGSANMDRRSFSLNFELNAFIFDPATCRSLADEFAKDLGQAREITEDPEARAHLFVRLLIGLARLVSPLL